jgi:hypothetical protein
MLLIEGTFSAAGSPALSTEVSRNAWPGVEARTQAVYQTVLLLAQVAGSVGEAARCTSAGPRTPSSPRPPSASPGSSSAQP